MEGQGGQAELGHVPYRESKLTRLLQVRVERLWESMFERHII